MTKPESTDLEPVFVGVEVNLLAAVIEAAEENTEECRREHAERFAGYLHTGKKKRVMDLYDEQLLSIATAKALLPVPQPDAAEVEK